MEVLFILTGVLVLLLVGFILWQRHILVLAKSAQDFAMIHIATADGELTSLKAQLSAVQEGSAQKDVLLERSTNAIEQATTYLKAHQLYGKTKEEELAVANQKLELQQEQYDKLMHQKKSSEVRTGKIVEQVAPFLDDYPLRGETTRFLGDPIDIVSFGPDRITFVEVKSGEAQLNARQREIRDMIKAGKVDFLVYKIKGNTDVE